jgi:hypothetical protein
MYSLRRRLPLLSLALPVSAAITICCGNSIATAASSSTASASASKVRAAGGPLSGTWSGRYSGAYHGTFTLHWTQSDSGSVSGKSMSGRYQTPPARLLSAECNIGTSQRPRVRVTSGHHNEEGCH